MPDAPPTPRPLPARARALLGQAVRRAARPALAGPGSPVQDLRDRVDAVERTHAVVATREDLDALAARIDQGNAAVREEMLRLFADRDDAQAELIAALENLRRRNEAADVYVARATALPFTADDAFETFHAPGAGRVLGFRDAGGAREDRYRAFEDVFRGSEEHVRELQRPYLAVLEDRAPVLDLGCGRGEFLDLLAEAGIEARGVDADAGMVARCRAKGHADVEQGDGLAFLREQPDRSLGAVFSAQVVEHLPFAVLEELLATAPGKLRPGGLFIAETVNPHAADALKAFWLDPTHEHPLFPEVMLTLARIAGFAAAWVFHPNGTGDVERDRLEQPAYALVARAE